MALRPQFYVGQTGIRIYRCLQKIPTLVVYTFVALLLLLATMTIRNRFNRQKQRREKVERKRCDAEQYKYLLEQRLLMDGVLVTDNRREIVRLPAADLLRRLCEGNISCVEVIRAYQAKALEITKGSNCVTEFIKEAEDWARELDRCTVRGPLHGLPISIKENVGIGGYDSTLGCAFLIGKPVAEDAALLAALRNLGAVPFCLTNLSQAIMSYGCSNPVWGQTQHPLSKDRTPGGSSGGEACLIAAGGSLLGIGNDTGGSVRVPAAFCGIASIKPTTFRLSFKGSKLASAEPVGVPTVNGLMARDVDTLRLVSQLLLEKCYMEHYDAQVLPIPWNDQLSPPKRRLRIGFYDDDGFFPPTPGVRRAVHLVRDTLEKFGHQLIRFDPPEVERAIASFFRLGMADRGKYITEALADEDIDPTLKPFIDSVTSSLLVRKLQSLWLDKFAPRLRPLTGTGGRSTVHSCQLWNEMLNKSEYRSQFLAAWRQKGLDFCIAPPFACPAPLSKDMDRVCAAGSYTILYNYLDFPAGIVPVTEENEQDQLLLEEYNHGDFVCSTIKNTTRGAVGMPLGVQVIGLPYQEEMVLHGMKTIQTALRS